MWSDFLWIHGKLNETCGTVDREKHKEQCTCGNSTLVEEWVMFLFFNWD